MIRKINTVLSLWRERERERQTERSSGAVSMVSSFVFPKWSLLYETLPTGKQGVLLPCRWVNNIETFEVLRGGALGVFRSCHQTKPMVTSSSSMLSNRITCLDEPSGEKNKTKTWRLACSAGARSGFS